MHYYYSNTLELANTTRGGGTPQDDLSLLVIGGGNLGWQ